MSVAEKRSPPIRTAVMLCAGDGQRLRPVANGKPKCLVGLLGLTLLERNLQTLKEAGIEEVLLVVGYQGQAVEEAVEPLRDDGLTVRCLANPHWRNGNGLSLMQARAAVRDEPRFLVLMADHLFDPGTLRDFVAHVPDDARSHLLVDFDPDAGVDEKDATHVCVAGDGQICAIDKGLGGAQGVDCGLFVFTQSIFPALEKSFAAGDYSVTAAARCLAQEHGLGSIRRQEGFWQDIDTPADYQNAQKKLLAALASPGDGFIAHYLNRALSRPITAWLCRTRVTPNQVTILSLLIGLAGALLFVLGQPLWAGLTVQLASIVDGVDGELARLKRDASAFGAFLDSLLDRYADGLIFLAMGYYAYTRSPGWAPLLLTAAALLGVPLSMVFKDRYRIAFGHSYTPQTHDGWFRYLLPNRDGRLFVAMLGGVTGWVLPALAFIALGSHLVFFRRLLFARMQHLRRVRTHAALR
ncbi:MAG: CDP-alcohol phosphatidyltransferase family protein [Terriglobia bacterium]